MSNDKFWERVRSHTYYRGVLGNMGRHDGGATVRFGTTGAGVHPNYQITQGHSIRMYLGMSHAEDRSAGRTYDETNLSEEYGFADVQRMIASALAPG